MGKYRARCLRTSAWTWWRRNKQRATTGAITLPPSSRGRLAPKTVADRVVVITRFFGFLLQEGLLATDPSRRVPYPKIDQRLPRALSVPAVQRLIAVFDQETPVRRRDQLFFQLADAAGLCISEVSHACATDVNWTEGSLRVMGMGRQERRVYLKAAMLQALRRYSETFQRADLLFPGRKYPTVSIRQLDDRFKLYVEAARLPGWVTPHCPRHSIAVHYLLGGAPLSFAQALLGHASLVTTGIYTRLTDHMTRDIALCIVRALDLAAVDW
jgi:site-specific recombinase XerD